MKILVTGVAGAIGSHVAEALAQRGHEVVGVDVFTDYYDPVLKEINAKDVAAQGVKIVRADLAEDDLSSLVEGVEVVYHFAAQPGISATTPFDVYVRNNITATHRLLEAVKGKQTLRLFVNVSTSSVYGYRARGNEEGVPEPISFYGVTKLAAEQLALSYCREGGRVPVVSVRLFSVYGERERPEKLYTRLIKAIHEDREFPLYEGSEYHVRSYTYIGDAVAGFLAILDHADKVIGEIFNIGSDVTFTTGNGIELIQKIMNKKAKFVILPRRQGDVFETHADIAKARELLGYNPKTLLEQGLAKQVAWYLEKFNSKK